MNTSCIIVARAGHVPPRGYLQVALKHNPTCFGICVQDKDEQGEFLTSAAETRTIAADDLFKKLEELKDVNVVVHLGNMTQDFDKEDDLQPWTFQKAVEGQDPMDILNVFMEGDFPNYSKPGKGHTDEYNLWDNFVYPTILEKYQAVQGDDEAFFAKLRESVFEQAVMNTVGHRAAVVLVPYTGDIIAFGKNELGGEFEWGTTSNRYGWGDPTLLEKAADAAVEVVKRGRGRLASLMDTSAIAVVPAEPRPDPVKTDKGNGGGDPPGVHRTTPKVDPADPFAAWPGTSSKTHTMVMVPPGLQGNARNRWIRIFLALDAKADLPKGKDGRDFRIPVPNTWVAFTQDDVSTNDEVRDLAAKVKSFQASGAVSAGMKQAVASGDVDPAKMASTTKIEPTAAPPEKRPTSDFLPEIKADDKKGSMDVIHDWATNKKRPSALDLQKIEMKWPLATTTFGIKWDDVLQWSIADIKALAKKYPDVLSLFFIEAKLRANGAVIDEINTEHQNDAGKQVEVPSPQPGTAPTQPSTQPAGRKSRLASLTSAA